MEKEKISKRRTVKHQGILVLLLAFALLLLAVASNAQPVYAAAKDSSSKVAGTGKVATPQQQTPGDGGGTDPFTHAPGWIEGVVTTTNQLPWHYIAGLTVSLDMGGYYYQTTTDNNGYFSIYGFAPNTRYTIGVNGLLYTDTFVYDTHYGKWIGYFDTDIHGSCAKFIYIQPASTVNVTFAALFSNTQHATLYYGTESNNAITHTLNFNVPTIGISTGFTTSLSQTYSVSFYTAPSHSMIVYKPYYTATTYDERVQKVSCAGITEQNMSAPWGSAGTHEYVSLQNVDPRYSTDITVAPGGCDFSYTETSSYTWQASVVPFGITFPAWGQMISIDITVSVTQGNTQWVRAVFDNPTETTLTFRVYTPGARPQNLGTGGMEMHVWDLSGYG